MYFPKWNPTEGDLGFHYIQNDAPTCVSVMNMNPLMGCTYDFNTQILLISYPVVADTPGYTEMSFDIDSFWNPYSGIPRTGFTIITTDAVGGEIDSTVIAGLVITLQVTMWTSFYSITLSRVDTMTTVGELSTVKFYFNLDLPVDSNCRIKVVFPSDMPITTGLTELTSEGILTATLAPPTYFDEASNSFYIDGCDSYVSYIEDTLYLFKMKNKGWVMDTFSFSLYLYAIDTDGTPYPVAKQESGLYFRASDFTPGIVTTLTVVPVETTEVQNHTRYTVHIWPVHDIP